MEEIKQGDYIKIIGQTTIAEVIAVRGNDLEIAMGPMKMNVKKSKVELVHPPAPTNQTPQPPKQHVDTKEKLMHFKFELDLRGKMKEEVMVELASWTDDAILLGIKEATILHGRGNGILKETVRQILRKYKDVESTGDAPREKGGEGVTLVKFKE